MMNRIKGSIAFLALSLLPLYAVASSGGAHLEDANIDLTNNKSIQRGAKTFVNYCMGCHSAKYVRYQQLNKVGLSDSNILENLMFADAKLGDQMTIAMSPKDGAEWFGAPPPDLTLLARIRGADWLYSYFKGFYVDETRPLGYNNQIFPNVGMPHVLWELQGEQRAVYKEAQGDAAPVIDHLELVRPGTMTPEEYDDMVRDLATFMVYIAEPMQLERRRLGVWVILFLLLFTVLAYFMKKEYWKDIH